MLTPPFYCKKRKEVMEEACADCDDCPGTGEDKRLNSFRTGVRNAMGLEDVLSTLGRIV